MTKEVNTNITSNSGVQMDTSDANSYSYKTLPADKTAAITIEAIEKNQTV